jgi:hypothetical protein
MVMFNSSLNGFIFAETLNNILHYAVIIK